MKERLGLIRWWVWLLALGPALFLPGLASASEIKPPFGFSWGDNSARLEQVIKGVKAEVVERREVNKRQVITVEGIQQKMLLRALFYFDEDALTEVELHYGDPSWDGTKYASFFESTRAHIDAKYGPGKAIARQKSRTGETLQTLIGYQWSQPGASLQLFLFTAERGAETVRVMSLHYKGM